MIPNFVDTDTQRLIISLETREKYVVWKAFVHQQFGYILQPSAISHKTFNEFVSLG